MSIYANILQLAGAEQQIKSAQTLDKMHEAQTDQIEQQSQVEAQTRQSLRALQLARDTAAQANQTKSPEQADKDAAAPPNQGGIMGTPQMQAYQDRIKARSSDYEFYRQAADTIRRSGGDMKLMEKYDDNARQAQTDIATEQHNMLLERKDALGRVASAAGSASADNWSSVRSDLDSMVPGWDKGKDVDFDPLQGGQVIWGPRTQRVVASMAKQGLTAYQQTEAAAKESQEKRLAERQADQHERDQVSNRKDESAIALNRSKLGYYERKTDAVLNPKAKADKSATADVKRPAQHEVADLADDLRTEHTLPASQSKLMAADILERRNEIMTRNPGTPIADATSQATAEAEKRVTPAVKATGFFGKDTPASYKRVGKGGGDQGTETPPAGAEAPTASKTADSGDDKAAAAATAPFTAAKIPVEYKDGVLTSKGGPVPMTDALYAKLPSGTTFVGPDGKKRRKP